MGGGAAARLAVRGYEMREGVGEGRFGPVYRAFQPTVGQEVAVEVVRSELADDPGFIRRFDAEADAVAKLDHPSIVPLHDHWREPGAAYLVTGLVPGSAWPNLCAAGRCHRRRALAWSPTSPAR